MRCCALLQPCHLSRTPVLPPLLLLLLLLQCSPSPHPTPPGVAPGRVWRALPPTALVLAPDRLHTPWVRWSVLITACVGHIAAGTAHSLGDGFLGQIAYPLTVWCRSLLCWESLLVALCCAAEILFAAKLFFFFLSFSFFVCVCLFVCLFFLRETCFVFGHCNV